MEKAFHVAVPLFENTKKKNEERETKIFKTEL